MTYHFVCKCKHTKDIECSMSDPLPTVICEKCGGTMYQDFHEKFKNETIIIPYNFRAVGDSMYQYQSSYGKHAVHEKQLY